MNLYTKVSKWFNRIFFPFMVALLVSAYWDTEIQIWGFAFVAFIIGASWHNWIESWEMK